MRFNDTAAAAAGLPESWPLKIARERPRMLHRWAVVAVEKVATKKASSRLLGRENSFLAFLLERAANDGANCRQLQVAAFHQRRPQPSAGAGGYRPRLFGER